MKEEAVTDALLRRFLLEKVDDEERQRIESLFLTDSLVNERILAAEQNLIDDYVEDRLSPADQETFLSVYGDTAAQRRKLRIAKSIQEWAVTQPATPSVTPERAISAWDRLLEQLRLKPVLFIPIAVAASVAIVAAFVWVNSSRTERHRQYLAVQEELARLNTPSSLLETPPGMPLLTLKPGSVRSIESEAELKKSAGSSVAELRLLWTQEEYPTYHAVLRPPGGEQPYTIQSQRAENENGTFIRVRLPSLLLTRGSYQIELSGVSADGIKGTPEIYTFTVAD